MVHPRMKKDLGPPPKKRKVNPSIPEITFDSTARADYLTGFHKRKVQRIKHSQDNAIKRAKEEKIEQRADLRKQRARNLEEHVEAINASIRMMNGNGMEDISGEEDEADKEWNGFAGEEQIVEDEEYIDEDQYATVTVEAVDITRDGFVAARDGSDNEEEVKKAVPEPMEFSSGQKPKLKPKDKQRKPWLKARPEGDGKPKRKASRNFKYESKDERRANRGAIRSKNKAAATARKGKD